MALQPFFHGRLFVGYQSKKGGNNFHFSAIPWDRYAWELVTFQHSDDSLTLSHIFGLYKLDQHQWSYSSLHHQLKHKAPHVQGRELRSGRF